MSKHQTNQDTRIIFSYIHCDKTDFAHEVSFNEDNFTQDIQKILETNIPIESVELEFILEDKATSPRFTVILRIKSSKSPFVHTEETYSHYSSAVYAAIGKGLDFVRQEKEKLTK